MRTTLSLARAATFCGLILAAAIAAGCTGPPQGAAPVTTPAVPVTVVSPAILPVIAGTAPSTPAVSSPPVAVTIRNFAFSPSSITVPRGTTVTWTNQDAASHTVVNDATSTIAQGQLFSSGTLGTGQSFSYTFNDTGVYGYSCSIHPFMKGTVTVT